MPSKYRPADRREALKHLATAISQKVAEEHIGAGELSDADRISEESVLSDDGLNESVKKLAKEWFPQRAKQIESHPKYLPLSNLLNEMGL